MKQLNTNFKENTQAVQDIIQIENIYIEHKNIKNIPHQILTTQDYKDWNTAKDYLIIENNNFIYNDQVRVTL